ncbi:hypothetical protein [Virgibacillus ihumii]|uniref:hypothetical protein n=1 Tax=Virgibacillus ihumii TaxID=2686091 RepID=UPI00157D0666|nr:hypothetical protein [Virgibacillus ihumii]
MENVIPTDGKAMETYQEIAIMENTTVEAVWGKQVRMKLRVPEFRNKAAMGRLKGDML